MKLLLTSGGVTNPSIRDALVDLLGKPTADAIALCIPTAQWGHPMCGPVSARGFVSGLPRGGRHNGWKLGLLECRRCPDRRGARCPGSDTDVLLLTAAMRRTCATGCKSPGCADLLPSLPGTVGGGAPGRDDALDRRLCEVAVAPDGRPRRRRLLDLASGRLPENTMAEGGL